MRRFLRPPFAVVLALVAAAPAAAAQRHYQFQLTDWGSQDGDRLGHAVSMFKDRVLIGAPDDDERGFNAGMALLFHYNPGRQDWRRDSQILPPAGPGSTGARFGAALRLAGNQALIGAPGYNNGSAIHCGAVMVFRVNHATGNWDLSDTLLASDSEAEDGFGSAVDLDGDLALIGAPFEDSGGVGAGAAYLFAFDPLLARWTEVAKLQASDRAPGDSFGAAVALSGSLALVGAALDDDRGSHSGSVYVFRYDAVSGTWIEEAKLAAPDGAAGDLFGHSLSFSGDTALIGARLDDDRGTDSGSVYAFRRAPAGSWKLESKLRAPDGAPGDEFGFSVLIDGDTALAGAPNDDDRGTDAGSAYLYWRDAASGAWSLAAKLMAPNGDVDDTFGSSLGYWKGVVAAGAAQQGQWSYDRHGAVYLFHPFLLASIARLSASGGGEVEFRLDFPKSEGDHEYALLASVSGTQGTLLAGLLLVPLTLDWAFVRTRQGNYPPAFSNPRGTLDSWGDGTITASFPPGAFAAFAGRTAWFAAVSYRAVGSSLVPSLSTNAVSVTVLP